MEWVATRERVLGVGARVRNGAAICALALFGGALALYLRSGAPSLLTGDQAEHQFTAYMIAVPHATGYPLFTMLNALAVRVIPAGDVARRATMAVALYSALAVVVAFCAGRRLSGTLLAGSLAALALAVAPAFWSLALVTDVYTLQALLILALLYVLARWWEVELYSPALAIERRGLRHPLVMASFLAGLGATHHGSFTPIVAPALLVTVAGPLLWRLRSLRERTTVARLIGRCLLWALVGFTPWLYLAAQYYLFRPFDYYRGEGLPYHPYWGNPASWGDVLNLALGAGFRLKVFTHGWSRLPALLPGYLDALHHQFRSPGLLLGALGAVILWRRSRRAAVCTALIWLSATLFGLNVAADVPKAYVYFLPAYVVWSLWLGVGGQALAEGTSRPIKLGTRSVYLPVGPVIAGLLLFPLVIGAYRYHQLDRSGYWEPRRTAQQILDRVDPNAVILCRWEDCMPLRYLQFVEGRKLGVQLDQTEPEGGTNWADRVPIYAPRHPVYAIAPPSDLAARYALVPIEHVRRLWQVGNLRPEPAAIDIP